MEAGWHGQPIYWHLIASAVACRYFSAKSALCARCVDVFASLMTLLDASRHPLAATVLRRRRGHVCAEHPTHLLRNGTITVGGGVLVPHGRLRCAVAQPAHEFSQCRPRLRRQYGSPVAKVVEPQVWSSRSGTRRIKHLVKRAWRKVAHSIRSRKEQGILILADMFIKVSAQRRDDVGRDRHIAGTRSALRLPHDVPAVDSNHGTSNPNDTRFKV